jgi:hypothetical protein
MGNSEGYRASLRHGNHHVRGESLRPDQGEPVSPRERADLLDGMNAERAFQQVEARARERAKAAGLLATIHSRARGICGSARTSLGEEVCRPRCRWHLRIPATGPLPHS